MPYIKQSIYRPEGNPGIGVQVRDLLCLVDVDDIQYMPARNDKGVVIEDDIVLKPNAYAINIYMTPGTVEITSAAEGDTDQIGFTPQVKFNHPGNTQQVREFKANAINRKYIVIMRYCSGKPADIIGSLCNPCKLTPSYTGNKDSSVNEMTFVQTSKGEDIGIYMGTIPTEEPVSTITAKATEIAYTRDGQYQASAGSAEIETITGGADGALLTIVGTSGEAPTVVASGNIMLKGGSTFVASEGSQLTLRAFRTGEGKIVWVEQSRYEA